MFALATVTALAVTYLATHVAAGLKSEVCLQNRNSQDHSAT